jgi:hypothetical protein
VGIEAQRGREGRLTIYPKHLPYPAYQSYRQPSKYLPWPSRTEEVEERRECAGRVAAWTGAVDRRRGRRGGEEERASWP